MKRLIIIAALALPMLGCASVTDYWTPARLPAESLKFVGETEKPATAFWGFYSSKKDLQALQQRVKNTHRVNVLDFQQTADREGLTYEFASKAANTALKDANVLQREIVNPVAETGKALLAGLVGTGLGWRLLKRPKDSSPEEKDREILAAGLTDPEEFKKKIVS